MESTFAWNQVRLSIMISLILIYMVYLIGFDPHWVWGVLGFMGLIYSVVEWKIWERELGEERDLYLIIGLLVMSLGVLGYTVFSLFMSNLMQSL